MCCAGAALLKLPRPRIADRLTLVWIDGPEYLGPATTARHAARIQPRYRPGGVQPYVPAAVASAAQCVSAALLPYSQLLTKVRPRGEIGAYLSASVESLMARLPQYHLNIGETYILGDSPLVLLTALQSSFEADPSSSEYTVELAPRLNAQGTYEFDPAGRPIRVCQRLDIGLLFNDFFAKLELLDK
jgi:purine nucleosidase